MIVLQHTRGRTLKRQSSLSQNNGIKQEKRT